MGLALGRLGALTVWVLEGHLGCQDPPPPPSEASGAGVWAQRIQAAPWHFLPQGAGQAGLLRKQESPTLQLAFPSLLPLSFSLGAQLEGISVIGGRGCSAVPHSMPPTPGWGLRWGRQG